MGLKTDLYLTRKPLAGFAAIGAAWAVYFAQMPVIKDNVGASDGQFGLVGLIAAFGAIAAMWLAPFSQRIMGGLALPLGIVFLAFGMMGAGYAGGLVVLTLCLLLSSAGSGVIDVLVNARVSELEADSGRPLMNLNHALYSFAYAGGALVTGVFREANAGPVAIFTGLAVVLGLLAWASVGVLPDVEEEVASDTPQMPYGLVYLGGVVVMVGFLAEASTEGWSALHLERTLGGTAGEGALGPALLGLTMGIGRLFGHALSRFVRDTTLMLLAMMVSAAGMVIAGLAPTVTVALAGFALAGLGVSVVAPLALALVGRIVHPSARLAAISRASVVGYGAFFFGPPLMGFIAEGFGLRTAFVAVAGLLCITAAILIPLLARRTVA
jgi:MFS family permease